MKSLLLVLGCSLIACVSPPDPGPQPHDCSSAPEWHALAILSSIQTVIDRDDASDRSKWKRQQNRTHDAPGHPDWMEDVYYRECSDGGHECLWHRDLIVLLTTATATEPSGEPVVGLTVVAPGKVQEYLTALQVDRLDAIGGTVLKRSFRWTLLNRPLALTHTNLVLPLKGRLQLRRGEHWWRSQPSGEKLITFYLVVSRNQSSGDTRVFFLPADPWLPRLQFRLRME